METQRILHLFDNLYNGNPWLEITILGTLDTVNAEKAAHKPKTDCNSIWEIVNHLIAWRENVLQRVSGSVIVTPTHNYFRPVNDTSPAAWQETIDNLQTSQSKWLNFLSEMKDNQLSGVYPPNGHTHYEHIHGIIGHDAYHLGQIVLLAKHFS